VKVVDVGDGERLERELFDSALRMLDNHQEVVRGMARRRFPVSGMRDGTVLRAVVPPSRPRAIARYERACDSARQPGLSWDEVVVEFRDYLVRRTEFLVQDVVVGGE